MAEIHLIDYFSAYRFLQESGRWLILNGKTDQALTNLRRVARMNGKHEEGLKMEKEVMKIKSIKGPINARMLLVYKK